MLVFLFDSNRNLYTGGFQLLLYLISNRCFTVHGRLLTDMSDSVYMANTMGGGSDLICPCALLSEAGWKACVTAGVCELMLFTSGE